MIEKEGPRSLDDADERKEVVLMLFILLWIGFVADAGAAVVIECLWSWSVGISFYFFSRNRRRKEDGLRGCRAGPLYCSCVIHFFLYEPCSRIQFVPAGQLIILRAANHIQVCMHRYEMYLFRGGGHGV